MITIFYHTYGNDPCCADGFGAAYAAWLKYGDKAAYIPVNYDQGKTLADLELLIPENTTEVHVLDFSFTPRLTLWLANTYTLVWLDHHKSAIQDWQLFLASEEPVVACDTKIILSQGESGALLAWHYYHPDAPVPKLFTHIDDRDRWVFALPDSNAIHAGLAAIKPWSFEQWRDLDLADIAYIGRILTGVIRRKVQSRAKQASPCTVMGVSGYHVNSTSDQSELGHEVATQFNTFALVWSYQGPTNTVQCSFRSIGDTDVSVIAKNFGGGGHRNAAGCTVPRAILLSWLC